MTTSSGTIPTVFQRGWRVDVLFWLGYALVMHVIFAPTPFDPGNMMFTAELTFWQAVASYLHLAWPLRLRYGGKLGFLPYGLLTVLIVLFFSACSGTTIYLLFWGLAGEAETQRFLDTFYDYWVPALLGGMGMAVALTGAISLFGRRRLRDKQEKELETNRIKTELAFLRGQLNPHFLFNALNSIYVLIPRDPDAAQLALSGFSDLLRYQLYQSEQPLVPLAQELQQLKKFAELSRLRLEEDFIFQFAEPDDVEGVTIPPMLLLPLLENAIKYSPTQGGRVTASLQLVEGRMQFMLENRIGLAVDRSDADSGGIGLHNIRRRLALLFPDDHQLDTRQEGEHFSVVLNIPR
ncbi:sensor histidine kinase [Lewinella sp. W8]|uniref:sensor histidine kinase n=1 Tax=Lewinella sp. W8 TaxID=2528208 RepID=UPI001567B492|nr:histidine kinase [Lewinella sp. W8]